MAKKRKYLTNLKFGLMLESNFIYHMSRFRWQENSA